MQSPKEPTIEPEQETTPSVSETKTQPTDTIDISELEKAPLMMVPDEWDTYSDEVAGFSFQYPPDNEVSSSTPGSAVLISTCLTACVPYFDVSVHSDFSGTSSDWLQKKVKLTSLEEYQVETMTVAGKTALVALGTNTGGSVQSFVVVPNGKTAYLFTFPQVGNSIEESTVIKQILTSFSLK